MWTIANPGIPGLNALTSQLQDMKTTIDYRGNNTYLKRGFTRIKQNIMGNDTNHELELTTARIFP